MIIELFGLPGAGKSFVARQFPSHRVIMPGRFVLLWQGILFCVRFPLKSFMLLVYTIQYSGSLPLLYYKLMNGYLGSNARYMIARGSEYGILDQGHLQGLLSLFEGSVSDDVLRAYLHWLPLPDVLIVIDVPATTRIQRQADRGRTTRERFGPASVNWQEVAENRFERIVELLRECVPGTLVLDDSTKAAEYLRGIINHVPSR